MDVQLVIRPTIENNAYFLHPKNILLPTVTDTESLIRSDRWLWKIIAARIDPPANIRTFYVPHYTINFNQKSYIEMIDWNKFHTTEIPYFQIGISSIIEWNHSNSRSKFFCRNVLLMYHNALKDWNRFSVPPLWMNYVCVIFLPRLIADSITANLGRRKSSFL